VRSSAPIARRSGDELTIKPGDAATVAAKTMHAMQLPFAFHNMPVEITISIDLAYYQDGPIDPATLLKQANVVLYEAKANVRNMYRVGPVPAQMQRHF
jgi:GGDEF domain-containing protein